MLATKAIYKQGSDSTSFPMRRFVVPLALVLLAAAIPVAAAQDDEGPRNPTAEERRGGRDGDDDDARRGPPAHTPAPLGTFQVDHAQEVVRGDYVTFTYDADGVRNFTAGGVLLYDLSVEPSEDEEDGDAPRTGPARIAAHGAELRLRAPTFTFVAHDNPAAVSRVEAEDGVVTLTFAPGAQVQPAEDDRATFAVGNLTGTLRGDDLRVEGASVVSEERILVFLDRPRGDFDVHREHIGKAIAKGHVGAEATFNRRDGGVEQEVVSYGNVTMTTVKAEEGNLTVLVEGHGLEGRVLVLNVDGRVLGASQADHLNLMLDNASIPRASNLTDVLDPDDDGYSPEYYIVHDPLAAPDAFQLIVTVPHYSVHTLSVTTAFALPPPSVVVGLVAGLALLVPSALVLFRRPK